MAAAEDLCRGLVCSMLLFCVVASLWCIVNTIAVAIRGQAISIAVESFAAMGNQQPSAQPPVPPAGDNNQEEAQGQEGGGFLVLELSLLSTHLAMRSSRTSFCDNAAFASKLPIGGRAFVSMSGAE